MLDCRANTKGPETELTRKHEPQQQQIILHVIIQTNIQYKPIPNHISKVGFKFTL